MYGICVRILVIPILFSCSTDPAADISGTWSFAETINSSTGFTCEATGELLLAQFRDNNRFTGQRARTATCTGAPAGFSLDGAQTLVNAEISGADMMFEIDFCNYEGMLSGNNAMSGSFLCPEPVGQQTFTFAGTWAASR